MHNFLASRLLQVLFVCFKAGLKGVGLKRGGQQSTINKPIAALNNPVRGPKAQTYRHRWKTPSPYHHLLSGGGDGGGDVQFLRLTVVSSIIFLYVPFVIIYHQKYHNLCYIGNL